MNEAEAEVVFEQRRLFWERTYLAAVAAGVSNLPTAAVTMPGTRDVVGNFAAGIAHRALVAYDEEFGAGPTTKPSTPEQPPAVPEEDEEELYLGSKS
jgi:hypothetical protein